MMSQNPFDALGGGGGLDLNALMQQAQQMQEQLQETQRRLEEMTVDGTVAGGAVTVTVSGTGELTAVTVAPGTVDGDDEESLSDLGDLVVAAFRDARAKVDARMQEQLGPLAGGMPGIPGLPGASGEGGPGGPLGFQ
jgi:DNA-binding YbaB/EbfC family protein